MPQTIALIGAMPPEISLLQESLQNLRSEHMADFDIYCGEYAGKNVVLALSGIGKVNAALSTALVLQQHRPDFVINTGSAGGLGSGLKVGDVVIGTQTAHHDVDVTAFGYAIGHVPRMPARFESDPALCAAISPTRRQWKWKPPPSPKAATASACRLWWFAPFPTSPTKKPTPALKPF